MQYARHLAKAALRKADIGGRSSEAFALFECQFKLGVAYAHQYVQVMLSHRLRGYLKIAVVFKRAEPYLARALIRAARRGEIWLMRKAGRAQLAFEYLTSRRDWVEAELLFASPRAGAIEYAVSVAGQCKLHRKQTIYPYKVLAGIADRNAARDYVAVGIGSIVKLDFTAVIHIAKRNDDSFALRLKGRCIAEVARAVGICYLK